MNRAVAPVFSLRSDRLVIRPLTVADLETVVEYRNDPDTARYQDWSLPSTIDDVVGLVAPPDSTGEPQLGRWTQLGITRDGLLVGDVAVWLDDHGWSAAVGYTVGSRHRGDGVATEAVATVVDWLFSDRGVRRITASLDPRNHASARVVERCGFRHVGTDRASVLVRGEWCDDSRYELLREDRAAWRSRAVDVPAVVELVEVTDRNVREVLDDVEPAPSQHGLVAPTAISISQAAHPDAVDGATVRPWYRAVAADGEIVGFVMIAERTEHHAVAYLWRFVIDHRHQRRGIGARAIGLLARHLAEQGDERLELSFVDRPGGPEAFYAALGFERTGRIEDGEVVAAADLATVIERTARWFSSPDR